MKLNLDDIVKKLNVEDEKNAKVIVKKMIDLIEEEVTKLSVLTFSTCKMCKKMGFVEKDNFSICSPCLQESESQYRSIKEECIFEDFIMAKMLANKLEEY